MTMCQSSSSTSPSSTPAQKLLGGEFGGVEHDHLMINAQRELRGQGRRAGVPHHVRGEHGA